MNTTCKAIRVIARQSMVNYRKPASYIIKETFPLPPYSTVIGMVHKACGFTSYHPMDVSVQGNPGFSFFDLYTRYTFGNGTKYEPDRHNLMIPSQKENYGVSRSIGNVELISDIDLILHIVPSVEEIDEIYEHLLHPNTYLALGRHEDLIDIVNIEIVSLQEVEGAICRNSIYDPVKEDKKDYRTGTLYRVYKEFDTSKKIRKFKEPILVKYVENSEVLNCMVDEDGYVVCLV